MEHTGTITCLEFFEGTHLLSAAEDGAILVWDTKSWECLRVLRGHTGAVDGLSIHPSGKLALTVGRDRTLQVWNLLKGRRAYVTKLPKSRTSARLVKWLPSGDAYVVAIDTDLLVYATTTGALMRKIEIKASVHSMAFFADSSKVVVAAGAEDIRIIDIATGEIVHQILKAHSNRVRNVSVLPLDGNEDYCCIISSSNDGFIKAWKVPTELGPDDQRDTVALGQTKTGARLTCMVAQCYIGKAKLQQMASLIATEDAKNKSTNTKQKVVKSSKKGAEREKVTARGDTYVSSASKKPKIKAALGSSGQSHSKPEDGNHESGVEEEKRSTAAKRKREKNEARKEKRKNAKKAEALAASKEATIGNDEQTESYETMSKSQLKRAKAKALRKQKDERKAVFEIVRESNTVPVLSQPFDESSSDDEEYYHTYADSDANEDEYSEDENVQEKRDDDDGALVGVHQDNLVTELSAKHGQGRRKGKRRKNR